MSDTPTPTFKNAIEFDDFEAVCSAADYHRLNAELTAAREERDRLAVALTEIAKRGANPMTEYGYGVDGKPWVRLADDVWRLSSEVLQSLTTNETSSTANIYPCKECGKAGLATPNTICPICGGE